MSQKTEKSSCKKPFFSVSFLVINVSSHDHFLRADFFASSTAGASFLHIVSAFCLFSISDCKTVSYYMGRFTDIKTFAFRIIHLKYFQRRSGISRIDFLHVGIFSNISSGFLLWILRILPRREIEILRLSLVQMSASGNIQGIQKMVHIAQADKFFEQDYYTPSDDVFR